VPLPEVLPPVVPLLPLSRKSPRKKSKWEWTFSVEMMITERNASVRKHL
jgi:hypothetical protein